MLRGCSCQRTLTLTSMLILLNNYGPPKSAAAVRQHYIYTVARNAKTNDQVIIILCHSAIIHTRMETTNQK